MVDISILTCNGTRREALVSRKKCFQSRERLDKHPVLEQQVTLYPHADVNNLWMIHKAGEIWNSSRPLEYVKNNDQIMLEHVTTTRKLHSHDHKPPVSGRSEQNEVS